VTAATKRIAVVVLLVLATLLWSIGGVAIWANRQMLDTKNWVQTSDALLRDAKIRAALSTALLDRLYQSAPVETRVRESLPPQLQGLAAPAAAAVRQAASRRVPEILGSDAALAAWEKANEGAHKTLLKIVNGDVAAGGVVDLDVDALLRQVAAGTGLPPDVVDKLPPKYRQLQVLKSDQLKAGQDAVDLLRSLPWILLPLAAAMFAGAIFLSADRRRAVIWCGGCALFAGVVVLAIRRLGGDAVVSSLADAPNIRPAAKAAIAIGTSLLTDVAWGSILIAAIVIFGAWLFGPGRWATSARRAAAPAFRDRPATARVALGLALLLLLIWGPVPWTRNPIWMLVLAVAAFAWLEVLRRRTLDEFPDVPAGELMRTVRSGLPGRREPAAADDPLERLERLADLHTRGVLDEAEYEREKAALLSVAP
jgi:putative oligomerization/nucleic acid binding protein